MAITRIQAEEQVAAGTSVTGTWAGATTAGNLLVVAVAASNSTAGDNIPAISAPGGGNWVEIANCSIETTSGQGLAIKIFYEQNATSQANTGAFTATSCDQGMALQAVEYSGVATSNSLDQSNSEIGSTNAQQTSAITTTVASTVLVGAICSYDSSMDSWSSPTGSFTIVNQETAGVGKVNLMLMERIVSLTGTYEGGAQYGSSTGYAGAIASFKDGSQPQPANRFLTDLAKGKFVSPLGIGDRLLRAV